MATRTFENLFYDQLKDMYDAEKRITKALPKMVRSAHSEDLSSALQEHLEQTEGQIERLDQIFDQLGQSPGRKTCQAIVGLLAEGESLMEEAGDALLGDAAIIAAAQKVEHYEIASYGTLREWARLLGRDDVAETLQETLDEEGEADKTLSRLAGSLNPQAAESSNGEEEDEMEGGEEPTVSSREPRPSSASASRSRSSTSTSPARSRKH